MILPDKELYGFDSSRQPFLVCGTDKLSTPQTENGDKNAVK